MSFPLLLIPLAVFNIMVFLMPGVSFSAAVVTVPLLSGAVWSVTVGDILLVFAVLLLMFEVIKGARPVGKYFTDHLLSLLLLAGAAAEFLLLPQFASSTYLLLTVLAFVDFVSGLALRARRGRRLVAPVAVPAAPSATTEVQTAPVVERTAPRFDPTPAAMPTAVATETPVVVAAHEPRPITHPVAIVKGTSAEVVPPSASTAQAAHPSTSSSATLVPPPPGPPSPGTEPSAVRPPFSETPAANETPIIQPGPVETREGSDRS